MEEYRTGTNQLIYVHDSFVCAGSFCVIHNPSDHPMIGFKTHWRVDRGIMERICFHSIGHPDPDEIDPNTVHGCDGCCDPEAFGKALDKFYGKDGRYDD